jgi:hypothetical protein
VSARTRADWILWGALGCTLVGTAHAEYTLATATGVHWFVAASVPGALDLYVIRALQVHRDVLAAVVAMVVMNVASHLVTAGVLPVHWGLISAVGALAPLVLWRIHYLWRLSTSALGAEDAPGEAASLAGAVPPDYIPEWVQSRDAADAPVPVPSAPVSLPALVPHPVTDAPHPDVMQVLDSDRRNQGRTSMRALRAEYGWGQPRATDARKGADEYTRTRKEVQS